MNGANFNGQRTRRTLLWRSGWYANSNQTKVTFICLNPSTADEKKNDHSITKMIGFASRWGYGALDVVNLFDWMSTDPQVLYDLNVMILASSRNDLAIMSSIKTSELIICAWGRHGKLYGRDIQVINLLSRYDLYAIKINSDGSPSHPLRLPYDLKPVLFKGYKPLKGNVWPPKK